MFWILFVGVLLDQFRMHDDRNNHRKIGNRQSIFAQEIDTDGVVVNDDKLFRLFERTRLHLESRKTADGDGTIQRPLHVFRGDLGTVVEGRVLAELEGRRHVADLHIFSELRLKLVLVVILDAVRQLLHFVADQARVAIPRHFVARHVGADTMNVDVIRPAFRDDQHCLGARLRLRGRKDGGSRQSSRRGHRTGRF
jgi:hypothetical protein